MRCRRARRLLLEKAVGERLARHLASCEACRAERAALAKTQRVLEGLAAPPPNKAFMESLAARVRAAAGETQPSRRRLWGWAALPAAVVVAVLLLPKGERGAPGPADPIGLLSVEAAANPGFSSEVLMRLSPASMMANGDPVDVAVEELGASWEDLLPLLSEEELERLPDPLQGKGWTS